MQYYCLTILCEALLAHSCRTLLCDTLVGHTCVTLLLEALVRDSFLGCPCVTPLSDALRDRKERLKERERERDIELTCHMSYPLSFLGYLLYIYITLFFPPCIDLSLSTCIYTYIWYSYFPSKYLPI